jgi:hypothetical protein
MAFTKVGELFCVFLLAFLNIISFSQSNLEDSTCSKKEVENDISTDLFLTEGGW